MGLSVEVAAQPEGSRWSPRRTETRQRTEHTHCGCLPENWRQQPELCESVKLAEAPLYGDAHATCPSERCRALNHAFYLHGVLVLTGARVSSQELFEESRQIL